MSEMSTRTLFIITLVLLLLIKIASFTSVELDGGCILVGAEVRCRKTHLTYIPKVPENVTGLYFYDNYLPDVKQSTFENITDPGHLLSLYLLYDRIRAISVDSFDKFSGLTFLCLSGNYIDTYYLKPLLGALCHRKIVLELSHMGKYFKNENTFSLMNNCDIKRLYIERNNFKYVSQNLMKHFNNIKYLSFNRNRIREFQLSYMKGLETLVLKHNYLNTFPFFCDVNNISASLAPKIITLLMKSNQLTVLGSQELKCLSSLKALDISGNYFKVFPSDMLINLPNLQLLQIRDNDGHLAHVEEFAFRSKSLEVLEFDQDGPAATIFPSINETFKNIPILRILHLSFINMMDLPNSSFYGLFAPLEKLKKLYCYDCQINRDPSIILRHKDYLTDIDFGENMIGGIHDTVISSKHFLKRLTLERNQLSHLSSTIFPVVFLNRLDKIDFSDNPFVCDCSLAWFIDWFKSIDRSKVLHFSGHTCASPQKYVGRSLYDVEFSYFECHPLKTWMWMLIVGLLITLFMLAISIIVYRNRWNIKHFIYLVRKRKNYIPIEGVHFLYDAFVSYDQSDSGWVVDRLLPTLEDEAYCKLCIHQRDFHIGAYITDNIVERIEESKRIIIVLSDAFATSDWCMFELKVALNKHIEDEFEVIVIILQDIQGRNMDNSIKTLLKMTTYLEWTDDIVGEELFWNKLRDAMGVGNNLR